MSTTRHLNDRLLLAARAMQLCPRLRHCSLQMFGVRHSSLLTSDDYIAEEMSAFRLAIAQLKHLRSFAWTTPKENANFVGFSVAVVDLAFEPLIEGLEIAALDINIEGRRVAREKGDIQRYRHPLQRITLHHCIFPSNQGKLFFHLFTKKHPDDDGVLLFSHLNLIYISKAINVEPRNVAYLALSWQLCLLNKRKLSHLPHEEDWNPVVILEDVFVNSIWGPRLTEDLILENIRDLVEVSLLAGRERSSSSNAYIRALEESVEMGTKLDEAVCKQIRSMLPWQREGLINQACKRVQIRCVEGSIASYQ